MKEVILICVSIISVVSLIGAYNIYKVLNKKELVKKTTNEIVEEILHFDPAIPESEWCSSISDKFDKINYNEIKEMLMVLMEHKNEPLLMAFFALYYKVKKGSEAQYSRTDLEKFIPGKELQDKVLYEIVSCASKGAFSWKELVDEENGMYLDAVGRNLLRISQGNIRVHLIELAMKQFFASI
jgi:hypothetical protein